MARSPSVQFRWFESRAEAREALRKLGDPTGDNYGDRLAVERRLIRVVSRSEVEANERYLHSLGQYGPWRVFRIYDKTY